MHMGKMTARMAVLLLGMGLFLITSAARAEDAATATTDVNTVNAVDHEAAADYIWDESDVVYVTLNGTTATVAGSGTTTDSILTIGCGGTYYLSGTLSDGQIIVNSEDKKTVRLILAGTDIRCSWSAPLIVENAKKTVLILAENTTNYLADGRSTTVTDTTTAEPNAVIYSKDNLSIWGAGSLTVCSDVNDGISCKNGLVIAGGTIDVNAVDDGIRGKDYLVFRGGKVTVRAGGDGLKSDNDEDATMGYVSVESGTLTINAKSEAIQAATDVLISGGQITATAGGGSRIRSLTNAEAKGIAAGVSLVVDDGTLVVDAAEDCLHSNSSLTLNGGTLTLSSLADALHASSTVDITGGSVNVTTCVDGIDSNAITIGAGTVKLVTTGDGIAAAQYATIAGGTITVTSTGDAITAGTDLAITDGLFTLTSGGGSNVTASATVSSKALKGVGSLVVDGGTFTLNSADDAIHSDGDVTINGGTFTIAANDDGVHANANLTFNGGTVDITKSYEGLESYKGNIAVNGGTIHVVASDDGVNVSAGGDTGAMGAASGNYYLYIRGGRLYVNAGGDGLDSNGYIEMTDGVALVDGPTNSGNGALDHAGFKMTGGFLLAAGSSGMAQTTSTTSTQYGVLVNFSTTQAANTLVHIQSSTGESILTYKPTKQYGSVAFSSSKLKLGTTYDVYYGGTCTGTATDGLYESGTYTAGTKYASFTVTGMVTNVGTGGGMGGGTTPGGGATPGGGGTPRR